MDRTRTPGSSWFVKTRRAASVDDYETWVEGGVCPTLNAFDNATETRATVVVYSFKPGQSEAAGGPFITEGLVPTLQAQNNGSTAVPAIMLETGQGLWKEDAVAVGVLGERAHTLTHEGHDASEDGTGRGTPVVAFSHTQGLDAQPSETALPTLRSNGGGQAVSASAVRRLTPRECERLQGFPDDWTAIGSDSARYKQMGNAVTVNAAQYIAALIDTTVRESA